jgi:hypothetical protein
MTSGDISKVVALMQQWTTVPTHATGGAYDDIFTLLSTLTTNSSISPAELNLLAAVIHATVAYANQGKIKLITGTDPAAGAEIIETVPAGRRWRVLSVGATLVTNGTVANRRVQWVVDDGANEYFRVVVGSNQTASLTIRYTLSAWTSGHTLRLSAMADGPFLGAYLPAGHRLRTITDTIDAGDNWGAPIMLVEEFLEL